MMRLAVLALALTTVSTVARGQTSARLDSTFALSSSAIIEVGLTTGTIIVRGIDGGSARVRAESSEGRVSLVSSGGALRLGIDHSRRGVDAGEENRFEVDVPRGVRVIAAGASVDITVQDTRGEVEARTNSGDVSISGARGRVSVNVTSSDVELRDIDGTVRVSGVSGDQQLIDVSGSIELVTVSGDLTMQGGRVTDVRAESVAGDVLFASSITANGRYELQAHSGGITLRLDPGVPLLVAIQTFSGDVHASMPAVMQPSSAAATGSGRSRRMELAIGGQAGAGGPRLMVTTFSGDVILQRAVSSR
jgi:hypothetical protein